MRLANPSFLLPSILRLLRWIRMCLRLTHRGAVTLGQRRMIRIAISAARLGTGAASKKESRLTPVMVFERFVSSNERLDRQN
jgi:hypothetical protein